VSVLIKQLKEFIGIHKESKIIVCGCGASLLSFKNEPGEWITIGVNDVPKLFDPTYLLVTDHPNRFWGNRKDIINNSKSRYLFTCVTGWKHPNIVHFDLGSREIKNLDSHTKIDHYVNSPYCAVNLAYKLGAAHIGLIGVDFTDGHFYNTKDGPHPVIQTNYLKKVNSSYLSLKLHLERKGVSLYNLSSISRLELPKITIEEFKKL
jgi:hypothetical protein